MHHLFISDVHFGAFDEQKQKRLEKDTLSLIDYCEVNNIQLHVLGDLFDYWMELPNYIPPLGEKILTRFKSYHEKIGSTLFVTGNHDYWTLSYFEKNGFSVYKDFKKLHLDDQSVFLMHGDGLDDKSYGMQRPFLNRVLRHPRFIFMYQRIFSGKSANAVMKWFSDFTRASSDESTKELNEWAEALISQHGEDVVISGHDHIARTETFPGGLYINTGAFHKDYTLAEYKNGHFRLVMWNNRQKELLSFNRKEINR